MLRVLDIHAAPPAATSPAYLFGGCRLDVARRLLYRDTQVVPLPERVFQILLMLVESNGAIVHRKAIALRVWPGATVADGTISQHVYLLRQILGEHARDHGLVMAVNGRGYRLTAPVLAGFGATG